MCVFAVHQRTLLTAELICFSFCTRKLLLGPEKILLFPLKAKTYSGVPTPKRFCTL